MRDCALIRIPDDEVEELLSRLADAMVVPYLDAGDAEEFAKTLGISLEPSPEECAEPKGGYC
jgi:hypothetical protein